MANKVYVARETPIVWTDSSGDLAITLNDLAAGAVRVGARKDLGGGTTDSTADRYTWRASVQFKTDPAVGESVDIYMATSDGTNPDGEVGVADALITTNDLANLVFLGSVIATSTDADHVMTASGIITIATRYVSPVVHNASADNLKATANTSSVTLTPAPPELQ
jgi:hypothetical protein